MDLAYRLPLDSVTHIRIDGDVQIHSVSQTDAGTSGIVHPRNRDTSLTRVSCQPTVSGQVSKILRFDSTVKRAQCTNKAGGGRH